MHDDLAPAVANAVEAELRRAAERAEPQAALELGRRLLVGRGAAFRPDEGAHWLARAAELGVLDAVLACATLAAAGIGRPQSWDQALAHLQDAAAQGSANAQAQLRLICEAWTPGEAEADLARWLTPPARTSLCEAPRVRTIVGFLPPAVCRWVVEMARDGLQPARMYNPERRRDEPHPGRTNEVCVIDVLRADVVVALVRARISAAVRVPLACFEPTQVFHYSVGQQIAPHYDFLEGRHMTAYGSGEVYQGQRTATFLCYLNDDYDGGATTFPKAGLSFKGKAGDGLFFANVDPQGQPDRLSLHAGTPPTSGEKWIISQWIHDRPFTGVLQTP